MSRPIEPGCRAVVVNSSEANNGRIVIVMEYLGALEDWRHRDMWRVDKKMIWKRGVLGEIGHDNLISGSKLKRIDDYDGNQSSTWEAMKDIWSPDTVVEM